MKMFRTLPLCCRKRTAFGLERHRHSVCLRCYQCRRHDPIASCDRSATSVTVTFDNGTVTSPRRPGQRFQWIQPGGAHRLRHLGLQIRLRRLHPDRLRQQQHRSIHRAARRGCEHQSAAPEFRPHLHLQRLAHGVTAVNGAVEFTGSGRVVGQGFHVINADESDAFGQGTNALLGNIKLGTSFRYSPYRVFVGRTTWSIVRISRAFIRPRSEIRACPTARRVAASGWRRRIFHPRQIFSIQMTWAPFIAASMACT